MCIGDQVLEYNGIVFTGKTFEDVQRITAQPNGEIELVIKASVLSLTYCFSVFILFVNFVF